MSRSKRQAEPPIAIEREKGLFQRPGTSKWWIAGVRSPIDSTLTKHLSAGTDDLALANKVLLLVRNWCSNGSEKQREWIDRALRDPKAVKLIDLYNAAHRGELETFGGRLKAASVAALDSDLSIVVDDWIEKDLGTRADVRAFTKECYIKQVRYFIPEGQRLPKTKFTEQYVRDMLKAMTGARGDKTKKVKGGTQRNYIVGLSQFVRYALRNGVLTVDPLAFAGGKHGWAAKRRARSTYHEYPRVREIIKRVWDREAHAALALIFGSGIELGGLLVQKRMHIGETLPDGRGTIVVPGQDSALDRSDRKNADYRSERTIFVDAWAWKIVKPYVDSLNKLGRAPLWTWKPTTKGKQLRDKFYRAQVAAGFIEEPALTGKGNPMWDAVQPHTLHDARHSYCINRSLGLDGEPARSAGFCASQLGHGSEQMVIMIYKKAKIEDRVRTLQLAAAMEEATKKAAGVR